MEPEQEYDRRSSSNSKIHYLHSADKKSPKIKKNSVKKSSASSRQDVRVPSLGTVNDFVKNSLPSTPVYCIRPSIIKKAVDFFVQKFESQKNPTEILYSVKSNPDRQVLKHLFESGIKNFDVASIVEVKLIKELFGDKVKMYFMHPIKSRESIKEAYFDFGIRDFSLDSFDELHKILDATGSPRDLGLHVRLSIPNSHSAIDLSGKFGILPSESVGLLRKVRASAQRLGICFHVGSQCMDPVEYRNAVMITKEVVENAKVSLDVLDVGGGFPSIYPGMAPPNLQSYFDEIFDSVNQLNLKKDCKILC